MGIPVIITDIPGPIDAVISGKTSLVVKKADAASLESAMKTLAASRKMRMELGIAASKFITDNFDNKKLFKAMTENRKHLLETVSSHD